MFTYELMLQYFVVAVPKSDFLGRPMKLEAE